MMECVPVWCAYNSLIYTMHYQATYVSMCKTPIYYIAS